MLSKGGNMPKFKFVDFSCNLLQTDSFIEKQDKTLIIYPTANNANLAQAYGQNKWQFEDIAYHSIDQFKNMVLQTDKLFLEDDKRVIALYLQLSDEDKAYFHVNDFFDFIKLSNKIFSLFAELAEELLDFTEVCTLLETANANVFPWQLDYYERILQLLSKYEAWLERQDLSDQIFNKNLNNIDLSYFASYTDVYFINQFYYTAFEKSLISLLEESGKTVTLVYQMPEKFVDKESYNCTNFLYQDLAEMATSQPELKLVIDSNQFMLMNSLCRLVSEQGIKQIIDRGFYESAYAELLSPEIFDISLNQPIHKSGLYQFFDLVGSLLEEVEYYNNHFYLPTHLIYKVFLNKNFSSYFEIPDSLSLTAEIYKLRDKGILYFDKNLAIAGESFSDELKTAVLKLFRFIDTLRRVKSIGEFIKLIDAPEGIILDRLFSEAELKQSDIKEVVYTELANLMTYSFNNLITKWSDLSDKSEHLIIYKLFIDGLKSKSVKYTKTENQPRIRINSLLDTRNNSYKTLLFSNMLEGVLPTTRTTQFLFNEKQREVLHLKSYEDIRLREKYYFQRLILTSEKCYFLGIENVDDDITLSSFLEELPLIKPTKAEIQADYGYSQMFTQQQTERTSLDVNEYCRLNLNAERLGNEQQALRLSYTRLKNLISNPFYFVVKDWAKVEKTELLNEAKLDYRFIGIFAQDYVNHIIDRINNSSDRQVVVRNFGFMDIAYFEEVYDSLLQTYQNRDYLIPHNYSYNFVTKILKTALVEGMHYFFTKIMNSVLKLTDTALKLIPEFDYAQNKKFFYKDFVLSQENSYGINIAVTGNADLRIENLTDQSKIVIDYKTGRYSKEQLALYQYIYYWDEIESGNLAKSGIYQILKQKWDNEKKEAGVAVSTLKEKLIAILDEIAEFGFTIPDNQTEAKKYAEITRSDLVMRG